VAPVFDNLNVEWEDLSDGGKELYENDRHGGNNIWTTELSFDRPVHYFWEHSQVILSNDDKEIGWKISEDGSIRNEHYDEALIANYGSQFTCTLKAEAADCTPQRSSSESKGCKNIDSWQWNLKFFGENDIQEQATIVLATKTFDKEQFAVNCQGSFAGLPTSYAHSAGIDALYDIPDDLSYCCTGEVWNGQHDAYYVTGSTIYSGQKEVYPGCEPPSTFGEPNVHCDHTGNGYAAQFCVGVRSYVHLTYEDAEEK